MTLYKPVLEVDPSKEALEKMFLESSANDWIFDEETNSFCLLDNSVVRVLPNERGGLSLMYAFDEVASLSPADVREHLPPVMQPV